MADRVEIVRMIFVHVDKVRDANVAMLKMMNIVEDVNCSVFYAMHEKATNDKGKKKRRRYQEEEEESKKSSEKKKDKGNKNG